jgi:asparagine synthase (glutamine-hydrolysing)
MEWIGEVAGPGALAEAGVFNPVAAGQLLEKCRSRAASGQFSNADNLGVVGILSTQLVHYHFIRRRPEGVAPVIGTMIDRVAPAAML